MREEERNLQEEKEVKVSLQMDTAGIDAAQEKADKLKATLEEVHELIRRLGTSGQDSSQSC